MALLAQDEALTRKVGAIVLALLAAAICFVVFVWDQIEWGARVRIDVHFQHAGGLLEGSPLVVAGRQVGEIETVRFGSDHGVIATVSIAKRDAAHVTRGGDVFVTSRGPLGARYLEIAPALGDGPSLADDPSPLVGADPPSIDRVLQRTWDNLTVTREFAEQVRPEMTALRAELGKLGTTLEELSPNIAGVAGLGFELRALVAEARTLRDVALGGEPGLAKLDAVITSMRATIAHARAVLDELGARARALSANATALRVRLGERGPAAVRAVELAIERVRAAIDKVDPLLAKIDELNARIARGEGSLGRLMTDPEFPEDAKALGKIMKRKPWKILERPDK